MDHRGTFIAGLIDSASRAYATGAVARLRDRGGEVASLLANWNHGSLVADMESRLRYLAEALAAGTPDVFLLDTEWLKALYASRQLPTALLVASLESLRDELRESLPSDAGAMAAQYVGPALAALDEPASPMTTVLDDTAPHSDLTRRFLLCLLEGRSVQAAREILAAFDQGASLPDLYNHVIGRVQAELGILWQMGEIHVAEEHLASRIVEQVLALLRERIPRTGSIGKKVIVASVPGNRHDIGARIVSDHFEMAGWHSLFLGADTPAEDLARGVVDFQADLVGLSAGLGLHVRPAAAVVEGIRREKDSVPILVGGGPFVALPDLWQAVGADGSAPDAPGAVSEGARLVGG